MLRAKLLGGGRKVLPVEFSFRLKKIALNPAWIEDMNFRVKKLKVFSLFQNSLFPQKLSSGIKN